MTADGKKIYHFHKPWQSPQKVCKSGDKCQYAHVDTKPQKGRVAKAIMLLATAAVACGVQGCGNAFSGTRPVTDGGLSGEVAAAEAAFGGETIDVDLAGDDLDQDVNTGLSGTASSSTATPFYTSPPMFQNSTAESDAAMNSSRSSSSAEQPVERRRGGHGPQCFCVCDNEWLCRPPLPPRRCCFRAGHLDGVGSYYHLCLECLNDGEDSVRPLEPLEPLGPLGPLESFASLASLGLS